MKMQGCNLASINTTISTKRRINKLVPNTILSHLEKNRTRFTEAQWDARMMN